VSLVLPALVVILVAIGAGVVPWPMRPSTSVPLLSLVAAIAAGVTLAVLLVVAAGFLGGQAPVAAVVAWCPVVPLHHRVGWLLGVPALGGLMSAIWRTRGVLQTRRWAIDGTAGRRLIVLPDATPVAYAAPGTPGCVVVSSGLLAVLEPRERQVVFAHERAHLDQHHDRYLLVGAVSVAILPVLAPLVRRLRHATECCADAAAVKAMDGDAEVVATAIARAALASTDVADLAPSFGGGSVIGRINALVGAELTRVRLASGLAVSSLSVAAVIGASTVQMHHFAEAIAHICGR